jgi:hypothetical protein
MEAVWLVHVRGADNRDAANDGVFTLYDPEPISLATGTHELRKGSYPTRLKGRIEAVLPSIEDSVQTDDSAKVARLQNCSNRESPFRFAVGDKVIFRGTDRASGISSGDGGKVSAITEEGSLRVESKTGRIKEIALHHYQTLDYA